MLDEWRYSPMRIFGVTDIPTRKFAASGWGGVKSEVQRFWQ
jgi:hypothetical protein